jgi:hypothetical protein
MGDMKSLKVAAFLLGAVALHEASAQLEVFPKPYKNPGLWTVNGVTVDTLYMGASFTRTSFKPVTVSLKGNEAGWSGDLLFIDPKTGAEDRLFSNHDPVGTSVTLSDRHEIGIGDTVYFVYRVTTPANNNYPSANSRLPKYTGPNIPGVSKYVTVPASAKWGHRWSVAGRLNDSTVIFGFEDNVEANSDFDYDDIVFLTSLSLANDEVPAHLQFVDKAGKPVDPNAMYSPANDTVYLVYTDDYNAGKDPVTFNVTVKNRRGTAAGDAETFTGIVPARNGITGVWTLAIPLQESPGIPGDKKLEVYWLGEITATVASHTRNQIPDGNSVTASLNVAYPDKPETVKVSSCPDGSTPITRTTTCITVKATDQSFTRNLDTVWAEVKCDLSGDVISKVALIEQPDGSYKSSNIVKNETGLNAADNVLTCKSTDNITVTYFDEVYNKKATDKAAWSGDAPQDLLFAQPGTLGPKLTTVTDGQIPGNAFVVVGMGPSPTVGVKDTILVTLTTDQGDQEVLTATETDVNSNVYTVPGSFAFQTTPAVPGSGVIEAFLDPAKSVASVKVTGTAVINGKAYSTEMLLKPSLNIATKAYIKDSDGDGRGDKVYIVFSRPLEAAPATVTPLYWNQLDEAHRFPGTPKSITIDPAHPNTVVVDLSNSPFPAGVTSIPAGALAPIATLPSDNVFAGQKPAIADSMGPVIIKAVSHPFNAVKSDVNGQNQVVDTLFVTVSEPLRTKGDWQDLVRVGAATPDGKCKDYGATLQVVPDGIPTPDGAGTTYTIMVNHDTGPQPVKGECLYLNVSGTYTDINTNLPPIHGEVIDGIIPPIVIGVQGYPPVAGLDPHGPGFVLVNNDPRDGSTGGHFSDPYNGSYEVVWIPPADWPASYTPNFTVYVPERHSVTDPIVPGQDPQIRRPMPSDISAIQVITSSAYVADVAIYDNLGNFVTTFRQSFGYRGEMNNVLQRKVPGGWLSFLAWNLKDSRGLKVGNGVYVWKVVFSFKTGKQEIRYIRTGVTRNNRPQ